MADLRQYREKRDFTRTAEPAGKVARSKRTSADAGGIFVVHKHAARRLHYDLRLEHGGVLWSWAVTRGPSLDPDEKRLAVHVEDHPLDYAPFEGTIPRGEYGGGSVIVWDEGRWLPEHDPDKGMKKGHLAFDLDGRKLKGRWHLVRLSPRPGEKRDNWLLMKAADAFARPGTDILEDEPRSVKSGLTVEQVGAGKAAKGETPRVWHSGKKGAGKTAAGKAAKARDAAPAFVAPQLATLQRQAPEGAEWLHEVKFDGYRIQAVVDGTDIRLLTRTGLDWTERFGTGIVAALAKLKCRRAVIDGEIVVPGTNGASSFPLLQADLSAGRSDRFVYYAFDLLRLDGEDLRAEPLVERKQALRELLAGRGEGSPLRFSEHFGEPGRVMLEHACRMGLEGVVSKRADAPYRSGRGLAWIKSKCTNRQEFVIGGYLPSGKAGRGLKSLLVGYREAGRLKYASRVGTGFSAKAADDLRARLDRLKAQGRPFDEAVPDARQAIWVEPRLVAEVEFRAWTADRILRHASFRGLREDKPAEEVVQEKPKPAKRKPSGSKAGDAAETSVALSSPDKLLWPQEKVSKRDLLDHYALAWPRMEPFVVGRPLALLRAPDGVEKERFFQKHAAPGMSERILRSHDPQDGEEILYIRDFDGLAALVQIGVVEVHVWGCTVDQIDTPDQIVFDLDPDEGVAVEEVRKAALEVRARLEELALPTFVKTSGGKGYHVMVPLKPKAGWDEVKGFANDFARAMEQAAPERFTATLSKKARAGKIFIDYLRNGRGSTTVAPYSPRARKGAAVSMPVAWADIDESVAPDAFRLGAKATRERLAGADPWADFFASGKVLNRR